MFPLVIFCTTKQTLYRISWWSKLLPLRLPRSERRLGKPFFVLKERVLSTVDTSLYSIRDILGFYLNIVEEFLWKCWRIWWNMGITSQELQTDGSVSSNNVGIFTRGTSGSSEGIYLVTYGHVLVKFQYHALHNLWELFWDGLRKQWWNFWGNLWESLRLQTFVEFLRKHP